MLTRVKLLQRLIIRMFWFLGISISFSKRDNTGESIMIAFHAFCWDKENKAPERSTPFLMADVRAEWREERSEVPVGGWGASLWVEVIAWLTFNLPPVPCPRRTSQTARAKAQDFLSLCLLLQLYNPMETFKYQGLRKGKGSWPGGPVSKIEHEPVRHDHL